MKKQVNQNYVDRQKIQKLIQDYFLSISLTRSVFATYI